MAGKFKAAEGIRGIACLVVLVLHAVIIFYYGYHGYFNGMANLGVWLFFVLSAFLLTVKFEKDGFSTSSICSYLVGRFLRIVPLFSFFVFVYLYFGTADINTWEDARKAIFMVEGYRHLWTVPVEFKFYAMLPIVAYALIATKKKYGVSASTVLGVAMIVAQQVIWPYWKIPGQTVDPVWYLSCFTMGVMAAVSISAIEKYATDRMADVVFFTCVALLVFFSPWFRAVVFGIPPDSYLSNKILYFGLACSLLTMFCINGKGIAGKILTSAPLRLIGRWSFSIYLGHWLLVMKIAANYHENFAALMICIVLSIVMGALTFYAVEKPLEIFRHRFMAVSGKAAEQFKARMSVIMAR